MKIFYVNSLVPLLSFIFFIHKILNTFFYNHLGRNVINPTATINIKSIYSKYLFERSKSVERNVFKINWTLKNEYLIPTKSTYCVFNVLWIFVYVKRQTLPNDIKVLHSNEDEKSKVPFENLLEKIFNMPLKWNENEIYLRAPSSPNTKTYRNISCLFFSSS